MANTDRVGQKLGNYRLSSLLGRGGFAEVYLGEHVYLRTQAAIKVLSAQLSNDSIEQFLTEARSLASLLHPHIIRTLDFGVEDNGRTPFLVMDYAPGGTLRQHIPKGQRVPLATVVQYVNQVASALQYAHDKRMVHRDVKPENMLLGRNDEVLLSDFGIAVVAQSSRYESAKEMAGTIAYMAPEQIQSHPRPASDQYALGIVVYEWLTGDRPFHGSFSEIAIKHTMVSPPPLRERIPDVPPEVEQVVLTALEKDPVKRFATITAFAKALEQSKQASQSYAAFPTASGPHSSSPPSTNLFTPLSNQVPPSAGIAPPPQSIYSTQGAVPTYNTVQQPSDGPRSHVTDGPAYYPSGSSQSQLHDKPGYQPSDEPRTYLPDGPKPAQPRVSRRTALIGITGAAALVAAGGGATWLLLSQKKGTPSGVTPTSTPINTPAEQPTTTTPASVGGQGSVLYTYQDQSGSVFSVAWSPDSKRIASGGLDGSVESWDANSGAHLISYQGHSQIANVSWSPNGAMIASGSLDHHVSVWDAASGQLLYTYTGHSDTVNLTVWSPDSKRIASASDDGTAQVWDATTGKNVLTYKGHTGKVTSIAWSHDGTLIASASVDKTAQVWNARTIEQVYAFKGHTDEVQSVAWSPNNTRRLASSGNDLTAQIWDISTTSKAIVCSGHSQVVTAVKWSPLASARIVTASWDGSVRIWDAATGKLLYNYTKHSSQVLDADWSPSGKYIASASGVGDDTVQVWQA